MTIVLGRGVGFGRRCFGAGGGALASPECKVVGMPSDHREGDVCLALPNPHPHKEGDAEKESGMLFHCYDERFVD